MTVQQMKEAILNVYQTKSWRTKVANMYDDQVIAIYYNFLERGILNQVLRNERPAITDLIEPPNTYNPPECQQMTIFDLLN